MQCPKCNKHYETLYSEGDRMVCSGCHGEDDLEEVYCANCGGCGEENCCKGCEKCISDDARLGFALSALNLGLLDLSILGYELSQKIEFRKIKNVG